MHHNMSSETFQARMAVVLWAQTSLFPGFPAIAQIIADSHHVIPLIFTFPTHLILRKTTQY